MFDTVPLNKPLDVKFIVETKSGTLLKKPGQVQATAASIEFLKSPFDLKDEIKSMKGARWHGFDDPPRKIWTAANCFRNWFQLRLLLGEDVYAWFDRPLQQFEYQRPLMAHQKELSDWGLTYHYQIWGAEMGCISGDAVIHINRAKKGSEITLRELCYKFHGGKSSGEHDRFARGGGRTWDQTIDTYVRGFRGTCLGLTKIKDVVFQGKRSVSRIVTKSGKSLILTPDHEICTSTKRYGEFKSVENLCVGDLIMVAAPNHYYIFEPIIKIESAGEVDVYDIKCEGPYHNFVADEIVVANCGKTLSAIELMERSGKRDWWWIGPRSALYAIEREFKKWQISDNLNIEIMTYEGLVKRMENWDSSCKAPMGVIFDESSRAKSPAAKRTMAAQALADGVRKDWGFEGYVILMSGTPSPKSPADWWAQAEIAWPGFLKEGSRNSFEFRLGIHQKQEGVGGVAFHKLLTWRDDDRKCDVCGEFADHGKHRHLLTATNAYLEADSELHDFKACKNEVAFLYERLKGIAIIKHKKDCLDLPDKRYRIIQCEPKPSTIRVAQALLEAAPNVITGLTWLRELSDGFQYRNKVVGKETCPVCEGSCITAYWVDPQDSERAFTMTDMLDPEYVVTLEKQELPCSSCNGTGEVNKLERTVKEVPCPKDDALIGLLEENEESGRLVVFAGFTGSIDKITTLCLKQGWDVVRVDGRGWQVHTKDGIQNVVPLDYWADVASNPRVAFVAHPKSGGLGLTLVESRMAVYWSNSYEPESRTQSEDRIHRIGLDVNKGATIVDLIHLPTDLKVLELLKDNRRLELMTMGVLQNCFEDSSDGEAEITCD